MTQATGAALDALDVALEDAEDAFADQRPCVACSVSLDGDRPWPLFHITRNGGAWRLMVERGPGVKRENIAAMSVAERVQLASLLPTLLTRMREMTVQQHAVEEAERRVRAFLAELVK